MDIITKNIKCHRKLLSLSQQSLADKIHVTRCAIGSYEEGRAVPPIEVMIRMCRLFGTTLDEFCNSGLFATKPELKENFEDSRISSLEIEIERLKEFTGLDQSI